MGFDSWWGEVYYRNEVSADDGSEIIERIEGCDDGELVWGFGGKSGTEEYGTNCNEDDDEGDDEDGFDGGFDY
jgi:hypothetical protein